MRSSTELVICVVIGTLVWVSPIWAQLSEEHFPWNQLDSLTPDQERQILEQFQAVRVAPVTRLGVNRSAATPQMLRFDQILQVAPKIFGPREMFVGQIAEFLTEPQRREVQQILNTELRSFSYPDIQPFLSKQDQSAYCWAACLQSVLAYMGMEVSQYQLAEEVLKKYQNAGANLEEIAAARLDPIAIGVPSVFGLRPKIRLTSRDLPDSVVLRMLQQLAFIIVPTNEQHAQLLTGISWRGNRENARIHSISLFDPATGKVTEHEGSLKAPFLHIVLEGFFQVQTESTFWVERDGKFLLVDADGRSIQDDRYDEIGLRYGNWSIPARQGRTWGFIGQEMEFQRVPGVDKLQPFGGWLPDIGNVAPARRNDRWGFVDMNGRFVVEPQWADAKGFSYGRAAVQNERGKWGYVDHEGGLAISARFDEAGTFVNGVAPVRIRNRWTLINTDGESAIGDRPFERVQNLGFSYITVKQDERLGYIDYEGNWIIRPRFEVAGPFEEGLAPVKEEGRLFGFINEFNQYEHQPRFKFAYPFAGGLAPVETEHGWGVINSEGEFTVRPSYQIFVTRRGEHWVFVDHFGRGWYVSYDGDRVMLASDNLEGVTALFGLGRLRGRQLCNVDVASDPPRAVVYFIPLFDWESDKKQILSDREYREENYRMPGGLTDDATRVYNQVYIVLFERDDQLEQVRLDVRPDEPNRAFVEFTSQ